MLGLNTSRLLKCFCLLSSLLLSGVQWAYDIRTQESKKKKKDTGSWALWYVKAFGFYLCPVSLAFVLQIWTVEKWEGAE